MVHAWLLVSSWSQSLVAMFAKRIRMKPHFLLQHQLYKQHPTPLGQGGRSVENILEHLKNKELVDGNSRL